MVESKFPSSLNFCSLTLSWFLPSSVTLSEPVRTCSLFSKIFLIWCLVCTPNFIHTVSLLGSKWEKKISRFHFLTKSAFLCRHSNGEDSESLTYSLACPKWEFMKCIIGALDSSWSVSNCKHLLQAKIWPYQVSLGSAPWPSSPHEEHRIRVFFFFKVNSRLLKIFKWDYTMCISNCSSLSPPAPPSPTPEAKFSALW